RRGRQRRKVGPRRRGPMAVTGPTPRFSPIAVITVIAIERSQSVPERERPDALPLFEPIVNGGTEVNARVNPRIGVFAGCLGETRKRTGDAGKRRTARRRERHIVVMEESAEYLG